LPDAIFIFLGANDYSHIIAPGPHKFVKAYVNMLITIIRELKKIFPESNPPLINACNLGDSK
jgi:hypothetical protein